MSELDALHTDVRVCTLCALSATRTLAVPGDGDHHAQVMVVGEAPGKQEDLRGVPFIGAAGQLLDRLFQGIGLARRDVYITNIVKCRPPGNRDPLPVEVAACSGYLDRQVELIKPAVILLLGRHALQRLLPRSQGISQVHGTLIRQDGRAYVPLYHPAAALYNGFLVETLEKDFQRVRGYLDSIGPRAVPDTPADPQPAAEPREQLSLF